MAAAEPQPLRPPCDGGGRVGEGGWVLSIHLCRRGFKQPVPHRRGSGTAIVSARAPKTGRAPIVLASHST